MRRNYCSGLALLLLTAALTLGSTAGAARVYVWVDDDGVEHWSDRPPSQTRVADETEVQVVDPKFRNVSSAVSHSSAEGSASPETSEGTTAGEGRDTGSAETGVAKGSAGSGQSASEDTASADAGEDTQASSAPDWRKARSEAMRRRATGKPAPPPPGPRDSSRQRGRSSRGAYRREAPAQTTPEQPAEKPAEKPWWEL